MRRYRSANGLSAQGGNALAHVHSLTERGSTLVEFALVFPLLIVLTLALIDFSRCITVRGILDSAANRAVSLASVIQDLDTDCRFLPPAEQSGCAVNRQTAIRRILDEARRLPTSTTISASRGTSPLFLLDGNDEVPAIELILDTASLRAYYPKGDATEPVLSFDPKLPAGPSLQEVLQRAPVEITVRAGLRPYLWMLSEFTITGHAVGYRERRNVPAYPARLDCQSDEIAAGGSGTNACPCAADPLDPAKITVSGSPCACRPGLTYQEQPGGTFDCNCPPGTFLQVDTEGVCSRCPYTSGVQAGCTKNQYFDAAKCGCLPCSGYKQQAAGGNSCVCPGDFASKHPCLGAKQYVNLASCTCGTCPGGWSASADHTQCVCPLVCDAGNNEYLDAANCVCNQCPSPRTLVNGACVCSLECDASNSEYLDAASCVCKRCLPPRSLVDKVCRCTLECDASIGEYLDSANCVCNQCLPSQTLVDGSCVCSSTCPAGTVRDGACSCIPCNAPYEVVNNACVCNKSAVTCGTDGNAFDSGGCSCYSCPQGKVLNAGACICQDVPCFGGSVNSSTCTCSCPAESPFLVQGQFCGPTICGTETCVTGAGGAFRPE